VISTRKKLVYGVVLVAASGLFANELVNATRSEPSFTPIERAAEAEGDFDSSAERTPHNQAPSFDDPAARFPESTPSPAAPAKPELGAVLASLEAALERLESAPAAADGRRVDALVRQQRPKATLDDAADTSSGAPQLAGAAPVIVAASPASEDTAARRREDSERRARLQRFLEESPLSGVVCGADGGVAMFGGRIVRTGENLLGDEGLVSTCTPQGVGVVLAGREVWIPMPAVRVRPAASSANSANPSAPAAPPAAPNTPAPSSAPTAAGAGAANTPQAAVSSATVGGAANRTDAERSGGQK
jgi:hypothetical protein